MHSPSVDLDVPRSRHPLTKLVRQIELLALACHPKSRALDPHCLSPERLDKVIIRVLGEAAAARPNYRLRLARAVVTLYESPRGTRVYLDHGPRDRWRYRIAQHLSAGDSPPDCRRLVARTCGVLDAAATAALANALGPLR